VPAVDLALEHIKEQSVVGRYVLNYTTLRDSEVRISVLYLHGCMACPFIIA
jgi:hypothetical protein